MNKIILLFLMLVLSNPSSYGQSDGDINFFLVNPVKKDPAPKEIKKDKNDIELTVSLLFGFYQNFLSTQDGSTCSFYPSCSRYCKHAISKNGLIKGCVQGLDRLVRCNGLSPRKYKVDIEKRKLVDHVQ